MRQGRFWRVRLAAALGLGLAGAAGAAALTSQEEVGERIYFEGRGGGEPIFAYFGRDDVRMPAALLPCANCHGHDGRGRAEGGVEPPNITWNHLTKSYGHRHPSGREHGPFDKDSLAGAIAGGIDPAGNALDPLMPRYDLSAEDVEALVAFLERLETVLDPGLGETTIRIGTLLPADGRYAVLGQAAAGTLRAYFDEINATGGMYGRRLELVVGEYADDRARTAENARRLVEDDPVFAILGAFVLGMEDLVLPIFEDAGVPNIGPVTLFAGHAEFPAERTFFLLSGLTDQARALVDYAARDVEPPPEKIAIVIPPARIFDEVAQAVQDRLLQGGGPAPVVLRLTRDAGAISRAATELAFEGIEAVYFFADMSVLAALATQASARSWRPRLFLSGEAAGRAVFALPADFDGRIHVAYPTLPEDQTSPGRAELRALIDRRGLADHNRASQARALAAAKVLIEGLRRAGRSLSRAGLVTELEGLASFDTGQLPRLSFGSNRRIGALGAHVLTVDLAAGRFRPKAVWVAAD